MAGNLAPFLSGQYFDNNGAPLVGGKVYAYQAGTSTPQATYTDSALGTPNTNPVILDSSGAAEIWLDPSLSYKFVIKDSSDVTIRTRDNVVGLLTADAVNTASLQNLCVTTPKLALDSVDATILKDSASVDGDRAVTTNHIRDANITRAKLAAGAIAAETVTASKTANYTATNADDVIPCNATGGAFTVTLYTAIGNSGRKITVKKTDSSFNAVTIDANSTETIDGALTLLLSTQYESVTLVSDGSNWHVEVRRIPSAFTSYTPTFTGWGTATSIAFWWRRVGDSIQIQGKFTCGTPTGVEARVSLPSGLTSDSTKIPAIRHVGTLARGLSSADSDRTVLIESGVTYMTFGVVGTSAALNPLTKQNGNNLSSGAEDQSVEAMFPISGWEG